MTGPSLTRREAHHAIHEAAFTEAEELTRLLRQAANAGDHANALTLAGVLIEHWQTRTLRHAEAEEQGWYRDLARERPNLRDDITQLTRDHDLLRRLLGEIERIVAARGWVGGIVERFEALLLINAIHSHDEEQRLLGSQARASAELAIESSASPLSGDGAATLPLAVAFPALYHRGIAQLGERGIHPGDLRLTACSHDGASWLQVAFGRDFGERLELPLPEVKDLSAVERAFDTIAEACEQAVRSAYYEALEIPEPGAPIGRGVGRPRFKLTIFGQPKG